MFITQLPESEGQMVAIVIVNIVFAAFVVVGMLTLLIGAIFKDQEMAHALTRRAHRQHRVRVARAARGQYGRVSELGIQ
jgi:hypothetical protein